MPEPEEVLRFWFGDGSDDAEVAAAQSHLWWGKDPALDAAIRERFGALHDRAVSGALEHWAESPRGRLALIVVADQFSRNMFRGTAAAFAHDGHARRWTRDGLRRKHDRSLRPIERVFFLLPLQHSESLGDQDLSVAGYEALLSSAPAAARAAFRNFLEYARRHRFIVERFGRFPHRNAILGRQSTAEELAFLREPGSSF